MNLTIPWRVLAAVCMVLAISSSAGAAAEEITCRGVLGRITVDNVRVPDGATCTLNGTRAQGTVKVESGATLRALGVRVNGNIQAENAALVVVRDNSFVGGSIQLVQGRSARILSTRIIGDLLFDDNRAPLNASDNFIGGDLQAFQNMGGVTILRNRIDGNLQCKANDPPPTGGGNIVHGNKEDQCRRL